MAMAVLCAWCGKAMATAPTTARRASDDMPDPPDVTHGICPGCLERLLADIRAIRVLQESRHGG